MRNACPMHHLGWIYFGQLKDTTMTEKKTSSSRRGLLKGAVAAGALAAPMISKADTVSLRFHGVSFVDESIVPITGEINSKSLGLFCLI